MTEPMASGDSKTPPAPQPVAAASVKPRHLAAGFALIGIVILPLMIAAAYLGFRAHDRYVSHMAFSVRSESMSSAMEMLGGIAEVSGSSSSDTDILYNFIKSDEMVRALDAKLDLRAVWSEPGNDWWDMGDDPWYAYDGPGTIEDLTSYWKRMVKVYSDSGTGLINIEAQTFRPEDSQRLTQAIFDESSEMINRLSQIAREDKIRYARAELENAVERLKKARSTMTAFRNQNQIVDPQSLIEGQVGLLSSLQAQLAEALILLDILRQTTQQDDPRMEAAERRVEVITNRIAEERKKLGLNGRSNADPSNVPTIDEGGINSANYANIVGEYERLVVDLQFAEQSYTVALTAFDTAQAEALRQTRYLAAHIRPSLPERSTEPKRMQLLAFLFLILSLAWVLVVLVGYALRDRR